MKRVISTDFKKNFKCHQRRLICLRLLKEECLHSKNILWDHIYRNLNFQITTIKIKYMDIFGRRKRTKSIFPKVGYWVTWAEGRMDAGILKSWAFKPLFLYCHTTHTSSSYHYHHRGLWIFSSCYTHLAILNIEDFPAAITISVISTENLPQNALKSYSAWSLGIWSQILENSMWGVVSLPYIFFCFYSSMYCNG